MMQLFIAGFGYSAQAYARLPRDFTRITGSVRSLEKAERLREHGLNAVVFASPQAEAALATASALLISTPTDEALTPLHGDPLLSAYPSLLDDAPLKAIVYLSTTGVYGNHDGAWIDETTPVAPSNLRTQRRVIAEQAWLDYAKTRGIGAVVLRLSGIYGPGRSTLESLRVNTARRIIKDGQVFNRIHVEDVARSIDAALQRAFNEPLLSDIVNVADNEPCAPQNVVAYGAQLLGVPPPPEVSFENAPLSQMGRSFYSENKRVKNEKLKRDYGVTLQFPTYREGLKDCL
jgi:nucleoside-diphosphate-sugar epimerase